MSMHGVLIEVDVTGVDRSAGLRELRDRIVPMIEAMGGFHGGVWLTGNDEERALSLTIWDTYEAAAQMAARFGPGASPRHGAWVVRCELCEVAATAGFRAR
jgi:hypothetical protein